MRGRTLPFLAFVALILPPACGGAADPNGLLAGGHGSSSGSASGSGSGSGGDAGGSTSSSSGGVQDASPVLDSGGTHDSSGGGSSSSSGGVPEASPVIDAGGHSVAFFCPPSTCQSPDVCCATGTGQGMQAVYKCQSAADTCADAAGPGTVITCSDSSDCPDGGMCCGDNLNGFYSEVSCQPSCTGTAPDGGTWIPFCSLTNTGGGGGCDQGLTCRPSQILAGYGVCE